ncbi:metallophosphoesterase family protein [Oceaniglobus indicus]|uniref:metallophosphoesterase family protein n=1 Tax=Oceaniglobus indicus TaxID=2047749 RepID=UPI000C1A133A|nr:metallophosphoesterase [Oceaniglobus indicus]
MKRLVHMSDLHFGRDRPDLVGALTRTVNDLAPDLVAISGDLTQRARNRQFQAARAFIDSLDAPVLCVPGNHDVPLDNLWARAFHPWRRYKRWIAEDLEPTHTDDHMIVVGINTMNPIFWQRGWFSRRDIAKVRRAFAGEKSRIRIVVVHHPLEHLPGERKRLIKGADRALSALDACGTDIVLSGHLHTWSAALFASRPDRRGALQVQAGTGLSTRQRGEANDFNLLTLGAGRVRVERFAAEDAATGFVADREVVFALGDRGWAVS